MKTHTTTTTRASALSLCTLACVLIGTAARAQITAAMSTDITETTFEGDQAIRIVQSGNAAISTGDNAVFTFDELMSVDPGMLDNTNWELAAVNIRVMLTANNQSLNIVNNSGNTFTASDTNYAQVTYEWLTFNISTSVFESPSEGEIVQGDFPIPVLRTPNGTVIAANGGIYNLSPENPVQEIEIERNVTNGFDAWDDYNENDQFNWTFGNNPGFSAFGTGENLTSSSSTGSYSMFAEVEYIVIPEPGTLVMMGIALASAGGISLLRRRKRS